MLAKAKIAVAFHSDTAKYAMDGNTSLFLRGSTATTFSLASPRYFQFFKGYDYRFVQSTDDEALAPDSSTYYAWAINPDGTCAFISYTGTDNKGTYLQIKNILSDLAGTSTLGATQVGNVKLGTAIPVKATVNGLTRIITGGTGHNISAGFSGTLLTDRVDVGAILLQANANGNKTGYGFVFGAMAACYANGRIAMNAVEQTRDFGFTIGRGFETILGAGITKTPNKVPGGYLLLEHVVNHEGYPTPYCA